MRALFNDLKCIKEIHRTLKKNGQCELMVLGEGGIITNSLLKIADTIGLTIFGTSAKYISYLEQNNIVPRKYSFKKLRSILSTGSPLVEENFEYVYNNWKDNINSNFIDWSILAAL